MPYIVAEPCIKCKYTDCVVICPVMCFHEGANCLVIDNDVCIDCGACVDRCPVQAIFPQEKLPEKWNEYIELNARYASQWPVITRRKAPFPEATEFEKVENKREFFDPEAGSGDPP